MKRRELDQLINLAFGELSAEESSRVEGSLNPASSHVLEDYRRLSSDLRLLNNIPEPQIGTERIREAILRQGLKRRTSAARWGLVALPCAVAALALLVYAGRTGYRNDTSVASTGGDAGPALFSQALQQPALFPNVELLNKADAVRETYDFPAPDASQPARPAVVQVHRRKRHAVSHSIDSDHEMYALLNNPDTPNVMEAGMNLPSPRVQAPSGKAADNSGLASGDNQKLIVVGDSQDRATGAQQATEVDPSSNVVFGG
jgi:hypothetical protein